MLRRYETIFIVRADLQSDEASSLVDRYAGIIGGMDGTIVEVDNWGKRRLAYPIEKMREGVYVRIDFVAQDTVVTEVERNFKIDENILRFQTVKLSDKVDMEAIKQEIADALKRKEEQKKEAERRVEEAKKREEEQKEEARKKEEEQKEEEQKEDERKEDEQKEDEQKEEAISEPANEEVEVSESPDSQDAKTDEEGAQETSPVETDEERAKEE